MREYVNGRLANILGLIYLIVIAVLVVRPRGLFGAAEA